MHFKKCTFNHFSGALSAIVALQVIKETSEEYCFVFKIMLKEKSSRNSVT